MIARSGPERVVDLYLGADRDRTSGLKPVEPEAPAISPATSRLTDGAAFILDSPTETPAIWGKGQTVLWAEDEPLFIVAPPGVGKTTLAGLLLLRRHGVGEGLLGLPVTVGKRSALYVAADRPAQAARSLRRQVTEADRGALEHLRVWTGPLPFDLASRPEALAEFAADQDADTLVLDSLKDVALDLASDETGSRVNLALQHCVANGIQVVVLHHQRKSGAENRAPRHLDDVYGSTWLTAGAGSVLLLWGQAGDPIVELRHLKQPAEEFGPESLILDHERGRVEIHEPTDLVAAAALRPEGLTVEAAAQAMFGTTDPDRNQREKARRRLAKLAGEGKLAKHPAAPGRPVAFGLASGGAA